MLQILLVTEFSTDRIEKAVCMISGSIFLENVGGMKLKFSEEIEQCLTDRQTMVRLVGFSVVWR